MGTPKTHYHLNQAYLKKITEIFMKNGIINAVDINTVSLNDAFRYCLYNRYQKYAKQNNRPAIEIADGREFIYKNKHAKSIQVVLFKPNSKKSHQELRFCCEGIEFTYHSKGLTQKKSKEINVVGNIGEEHTNIITFILYELFVENNLLLPNYDDTDVTGYRNFKDVITQKYVKVTSVELGNSWKNIYKESKKLCYYLFDVTEEDCNHPELLSKKLSEWQNIEISEVTDIDKLYIYAKKIINQFSVHPMYEYLFTHDTLKHMNEVREILKYMSGKSDVLHPPVISVLNWVNKIAEDIAIGATDFTSTDFLHFMGFIACKLKANANHCIPEAKLTEIKNEYLKQYSHLYNENVDFVLESIVTSFKTSALSDKTTEGVKFKIKPFRIVCAAIYMADVANSANSIEDAISTLNTYFPKSDSMGDKIKLAEDTFHARHDDYSFFGLGLLYNLDTSLKKEFLEKCCRYASDFNTSVRGIQICYMYLLTGVLASDLKISSKEREKFFICAYGKTMYIFQAKYWYYLIQKSPFYEVYVMEHIKKSCELNAEYKAEAQPLFYFTYGLMCENIGTQKLLDVLKTEKDECKKAKTFLDFCSSLQCRTWYHNSYNETDDLIYAIKKGFEYAYKLMIKRQANTTSYEIKPLTENSLHYIYGIQLLAYAIANILEYYKIEERNNESEETVERKWEVEEIFKTDASFRHTIYATIASDYYMRKTNSKYPDKIDEGCLLCGSYRFTCRLNPYIKENYILFPLRNIKNETTGKILLTPMDDYMNWLNYELSSKSNKRYAYLMCRLLKFTKLFEKLDKEKTKSELQEINTEYLSYDYYNIDTLFSVTE